MRTPTRNEQVLDIPFPVRGQVENLSDYMQPPRTSIDMQNVVAFDITKKKARGGRRRGLARVYSSAIVANQKVQNIVGATKVLPASAIVVDSPISVVRSFAFDDRWDNYAVYNYDFVDSWRGWAALGTFPLPNLAGPTATLFQVSSTDTVRAEISTGTLNEAHVFIQTFEGASNAGYTADDTERIIVKLDVYTNASLEIAQNSEYFQGLAIRADKVAMGEFFVVAWHRKQAVAADQELVIIKQDGTVITTGILSQSVDTAVHALEVRLNKHFIEVYWDGSRKILYDLAGDGYDTTAHSFIGPYAARRKDTGLNWAGAWNAEFDNLQYWKAKVPSTLRENILFATLNGLVHFGKIDDDSLTQVAEGTGMTGVLDATTPFLDSVFAYQKVFFVDGGTYKYYDLNDDLLSDWDGLVKNLASDTTAQPLPGANGSAGPADDMERAKIVTLWGGRIVLSGKQDEPQEVFMSRIGDPFDWAFAPASVSEDDPVILSQSPLGTVGDPVTALMPFHTSQLLIGTENGIWAVTGNPLSESAALLSRGRSVGVTGPKAWAMGPDNTLFFMGTDGGLYTIAPNDFLVDETNKVSEGLMDKSFDSIDLSTVRVHLQWDPQLNGLLIFVTPLDTAAPSTQYFWSRRVGGFIPWKFPDDVGPSASFYFTSDSPDARATLLGGFDGIIRKFDETATSDDGTEIASYALIGPIQSPWPDFEFTLTELKFDVGTSTPGLQYEVTVGDSPEEALAATPSFSGLVAAGYNPTIRDRVRGSAVYIKIKRSEIEAPWALNQITGKIKIAGPRRAR